MFEWIKRAIAAIINTVKRILVHIFNFFENCVKWFRSLSLNKKTSTVFIADMEHFKTMLEKAPVKNVGIFEGVYDSEQDEIIYSQIVEADSLDTQTKETLGRDELVVLT